jgi:hypothetical protein
MMINQYQKLLNLVLSGALSGLFGAAHPIHLSGGLLSLSSFGSVIMGPQKKLHGSVFQNKEF